MTENIIGKKFGKFTVIQKDGKNSSGEINWKCRCDCGTEKIVPTSKLKRLTSCRNCCHRKCKIEVGQQFHYLTVINCNSYMNVICQCKCGKRKTTTASNLVRGKIRSCGCLIKESQLYKRRNIAGQKFGHLTALERSDNGNHKVTYWNFKCDCGKIVSINMQNVLRGKQKTCGCRMNSSCYDNLKECVYDHTLPNYLKSKNKRPKSSTGIIGVYYHKATKKFQARIRFQNHEYYLGAFKDIRAAETARKKAESLTFDRFLLWYEKHQDEIKNGATLHFEENGLLK